MNGRKALKAAAYAVFALLLPGCDMDITGEKREERMRAAQEREQEEKLKRELESQREAMAKFATGKRQFFASRLTEVSGEGNALRADLDKLAKVVADAMSEKDAQGKDLKYESKVLRILKNQEVNAIAAKHLASDFSGIVATYMERVRDARAADARYAAALESAESIYKAGIEESKKWSQLNQQQREREVARLQDEIKSLERERERILTKESRNVTKNVTRNQLLAASNNRRDGSSRELRQRNELADAKQVVDRRVFDLESQIDVKRRQIDVLRDPDVMGRQNNRALVDSQRRQMDAVNTRRSALSDIERHLKPKKSLTDTVAEFEADTVGKLRKTLSDKIAASEKEEKSLKDKVAMADEILLAIPLYDLGELKKQRLRLEK